METIKEEKFEKERSLYGASDKLILSCNFGGPLDGESPLKECKNIEVKECVFDLRYPLWHNTGLKIINSSFSSLSRAPLWYSKNISINNTTVDGIKFLRECSDVYIKNSTFNSPEFSWKVDNIKIENSSVKSEYPFLMCNNLDIKNLKLEGKYSFQYVNKAKIVNSFFDTKDAFWHDNDIVIENSIIKGEYLAWYAKNLTFKNCKIIGTQPFCYSENIKLINCTMEGCDFAFEYTSVDADIHSKILSIKNPLSGKIVADEIGEIIFDEHRRDKNSVEIIDKSKITANK